MDRRSSSKRPGQAKPVRRRPPLGTRPLRVSLFLGVLVAAAALIWPAAVDAEADRYGVVGSPHVLANDPRSADFLQALGVGWVRVSYQWADMEPVQGSIDWDTAERLVHGLVEERGLRIYWDFTTTPEWAQDRPANAAPDKAYPPKNPSDLYSFVYQVVNRFKGRVAAWGTWNEPNLEDHYKLKDHDEDPKARYVAVELRMIVGAIRAADPHATIVVGELFNGSNQYDWLKAILDSAGRDLDVISHHIYAGNNNCARRATAVRQLRDKLSGWGYGSYPLWITETGLDDTESAKTAYLNCFLPATHDWGIRTFWYRFEQHHNRYGLLDSDGLPNETYRAYESLIRGQEAPPPAPIPREPRGPVETRRPQFRWDEDALDRDIHLVALASDATVAIDTVTRGTSFAPAFDLTMGETYTWTIRAVDPSGGGAISESLSFVPVNPPPPAPPPPPPSCPPTAAPAAVSPSGSIGNPRPTLSWSAVSGAESYTLYVLRVSDDAVILRQTGITTTSFTPVSPLPSAVDLRWKVKGESRCGPGPYSASVFFKVDPALPCPPTAAPAALAPAGSISNPRPTFSWSAVPGAESYTLYVLRVSDDAITLRQTGLTTTSFTPVSALPTAVELRWKVKAESRCGPGPYSSSAFFRVDPAAPCPPTAAPTPGGPSGSISNPRPAFSWSAVPGAESYTLYVLRASDDQVILRQTGLTTASFTPASPLPTGVELRWKVKGESRCGPGPYSGSVFFGIGPMVKITEPAPGSTVGGTTVVKADAAANVSRVEFYVDGVLQTTDTTAPFEFAWDTTANPLPVPNHSLDYGYYFVEWKDPANFDAYRAQVNGYVNQHYVTRFGYSSDADWRALLTESLADMVGEGKRVHLALDLDPKDPASTEADLEDLLDAAAPFWHHVARLEMVDEPDGDLSVPQTEAMIEMVKSKLAARQLPMRPLGIVFNYDHNAPLGNQRAINAPGLEWVGIEAYLDFPGHAQSHVNIDALTRYLTEAKSHVPAGKQIVLVMMAYDRNGQWRNLDTLRDLQIPTYLAAYGDPRVASINMFAYGRELPIGACVHGGAHCHPQLKTPHRLIGERVLGMSIAGAGNGPRTLRVKAFDDNGTSAIDSASVSVSNLPLVTQIEPTGAIADPRPRYAWRKVDGATGYSLRVDGPSGTVLSEPVSTDACAGEVCVARPDASLGEGAYRWWVQAAFASGAGAWGGGLAFARLDPAPCPPSEAPAPGGPSGTLSSPAPRFSWSAVPGAESYTLYVLAASDDSVVLRETALAGTSFTPEAPLPTNVDLRWKVKAESSCGPGPYSPSIAIRVSEGSCPPSAAPDPIGPSGSVSTPTPTFAWTAVPGASTYTLYVLDASDESVLVRQAGMSGTSFTPSSPLPANTDLRWKVKAESSCGPGPYSPSVPFEIQPRSGMEVGGGSLSSNRDRLFRDWATRRGEPEVCDAWLRLYPSQKGAFLTLTHRLWEPTVPSSGRRALTHAKALYSIRGQSSPSECGGGDWNRLFMSIDEPLRDAFVSASKDRRWALPVLGNDDYWRASRDLGGLFPPDFNAAHDPFNATAETNFGGPRAQAHFFESPQDAQLVCRADLGCAYDPLMLEMDQDYNWLHDSSSECWYGTETGRQKYIRSHAGVDYLWQPIECDSARPTYPDGRCAPLTEDCGTCPEDCPCPDGTSCSSNGLGNFVCQAPGGCVVDGFCDPSAEDCDSCPSDCGCSEGMACVGRTCRFDGPPLP